MKRSKINKEDGITTYLSTDERNFVDMMVAETGLSRSIIVREMVGFFMGKEPITYAFDKKIKKMKEFPKVI
jgi:hypothetical protein